MNIAKHPAGEPLRKLYEQRAELATSIDLALKQPVTPEIEARVMQQMEDQDGLDAKIRIMALRDERSGGGIVLGTGRPVAAQQDEFRNWVAGGYHGSAQYEMRSTARSDHGGTTTMAVDEFTRILDRDSSIASLAKVTTTPTGNPLKFYRQSAVLGVLTSAIAEGSSATGRDSSAGSLTLTPVQSSIYTDVSQASLRDMPYDLEAEIMAEHAEQHAFTWESNYALGTFGAQKITDVTSATGNAQTADVSATDGTITPEEALAIIFSATMRTAYLQRSTWLLGPVAWAKIAGQKSTSTYIFGSAATNNLAADGPGATFMNFPVRLSNALPTPTTATHIGVFGAISAGYRIQRVGQVSWVADALTLAVSNQVRFTSTTWAAGGILDRNAMVTITT